MTPETQQGQLLTVFYCLIGLPITMLTLKTIGELIVHGVHFLILTIETCLLKHREVTKVKIRTFLGTLLLMLLFILLGSCIQVLAEDWSLVKGVFVWFVSLSTIGFGDFLPFQSLEQKSARESVPGTNAQVWFIIILMSFFLLVRFCLVSAVLSSLVQAAEEMSPIWRTTSPRNRVEVVKIHRRAFSSAEYDALENKDHRSKNAPTRKIKLRSRSV